MKLMWFPLIKCTLTYLRSLDAIKEKYAIGILGEPNLGRQNNKESTIEIDWDTESDANDLTNNVGEVALYILIKNRTDGTDMLKAYEEQYIAQNAILEGTRLLHDYIAKNLKIAVKISAAGVAPISAARPIYANQLVLLFQWKR